MKVEDLSAPLVCVSDATESAAPLATPWTSDVPMSYPWQPWPASVSTAVSEGSIPIAVTTHHLLSACDLPGPVLMPLHSLAHLIHEPAQLSCGSFSIVQSSVSEVYFSLDHMDHGPLSGL